MKLLTERLPKLIYYYFYFIDPYLGYGYIRVPTWCPFKLQVYINGHNILANELDKQGMKNSIKMYDKFSKILRIETTTNDVSFFKYYREVEHRNGNKSMQYAHLKKNIYSLTLLTILFKASNKRYLE